MLLREWHYTWTFHNGDTTEEEVTFDGLINASGTIQAIVVVAGDNTAGATITLNIEDAAGASLYTKAAIAHDATTTLTAASEAPNPSPEVAIVDSGNIGLTPSADPTSDYVITVYIYYVTEEEEVDGKLPILTADRNGGAIQGALCPISTLRMAFYDHSEQSLPFDSTTVRVVRLMATQDCYICFVDHNTLKTATKYDMPLKANIVEYFSIRQGIIGIAAIRASADGFLYITSMA